MALFQQIKKEDEPTAVINSAMVELQKAFERDNFADPTELGHGSANAFSSSLGIIESSGATSSVEIPMFFPSEPEEID